MGNGKYLSRKADFENRGLFIRSQKIAWYFRTEEYKVSKSRGKSLDEIKNKYGSEVLNDDQPKPAYHYIRN